MKRYPINLAADRALRDLLAGRKDQLGLRGQQVQRAPSSGQHEPPADVSGIGMWEVSAYDEGQRYS